MADLKHIYNQAAERPRVGLQFGSYNPPHAGHVESAANARDTLSLREVWLVPLPCSPVKRHIAQATIDQKLDMCRLITRPHEDWLKVSPLMRDCTGGLTSTLMESRRIGMHLYERHANTDFYLIGGVDNDSRLRLMAMNMAFAALASAFFSGGEALNICNSTFISHIGERLISASHALNNYQVKTVPRAPGSSTEIRAALAEGQSPEKVSGLPDSLAAFIGKNKLYRDPSVHRT